MKERAKELKAEERTRKNKAEGEDAALAAIKDMQEPDRSIAMWIHEKIKVIAPTLTAKTWYGMPAYAGKDGKVVCFFQTAQKFKSRYATLGFNDAANLDADSMWPTTFAVTELNSDVGARITALIMKAVS